MFVDHFGGRRGKYGFVCDPLLMSLSASDQEEYYRLSQFFTYSDDRNKRNLGMPTFIKHLNMIHKFICRGDQMDNMRGLICGLQFGKDSLLINTSRLKKLMGRSKSCMNGCFQKLGYVSSKPAQDLSTLLCSLTPGFKCDMINPRNWCVRRASNTTTIFTPNISLEFALPIVAHCIHNHSSSANNSCESEENVSQSSSEEESPRVGFSFDIMDLLNHHTPSFVLPPLVITN